MPLQPMSRNIRYTLITGMVLVLLGVVGGGLCTVLGMMRSFNDLSASGMASPHELSDRIGQALLYTLAGIGLGGFGLFLILLSFVFWLAGSRKAPSAPLPASETAHLP